jgi:hypothetical protein
MFDPSTALGMGAGSVEVCAACCGSIVDGKVAVTKSGVAVNVLAMFPPQLEQRVIVKIKRKTFL